MFSVINPRNLTFLLVSHLGLRERLLILHFLTCEFHVRGCSMTGDPLGNGVWRWLGRRRARSKREAQEKVLHPTALTYLWTLDSEDGCVYTELAELGHMDIPNYRRIPGCEVYLI